MEGYRLLSRKEGRKEGRACLKLYPHFILAQNLYTTVHVTSSHVDSLKSDNKNILQMRYIAVCRKRHNRVGLRTEKTNSYSPKIFETFPLYEETFSHCTQIKNYTGVL